MPRYVTINAPNGSTYRCSSSLSDVIEKINPGLWLGAYRMHFLQEICKYPEDVAREMAWAYLIEWVNKPCPEYLVRLYTTQKKKNQESLLRGKTLSSSDLICWILYGGRFNGLFSQYGYDGGAGDLANRSPILIDANDTEHIITVGKTDLSNAALNHLVENQKKVLAQFVDFEDGRWFCFYRTFRGMSGREPGNHGKHIHFISSVYGLNRNDIIDNFKRGKCPESGFHVKFHDNWEDSVKSKRLFI